MKIGIDITDIGKKAEDIDLNALVSGLRKEVVKLLDTTGRPPNVTLTDFTDIETEAQAEDLLEVVIEEEVDTTPTVPRFTEEEMLERVWEELDQGGANRSNDVHDAIMRDIGRNNPNLHPEYHIFDGAITHSRVNRAFAKIYDILGISESILSTVQAGHVGADYKQLALFLPEPLTWEEFKTRL